MPAYELTEARIRTLPAEEQPKWLAYWQTSQAMAKKDQTTLEAEVAANGLAAAIKAPDGGDFKLSHKPGDS